ALLHDVRARRQAEKHERELAALREIEREIQRAALALPAEQRERPQHDSFQRQETGDEPKDKQGTARDQPEIERHSHRYKEEPEQQPAKRRDVAFELMPILGVGKQ